MNIIIIFDIKFKTNQEKIEKILRHTGLRKIQTNTYIGNLEKNQLKNLKTQIKETIKTTDTLIILPICKTCYNKKETYGNIKFKEDYYRIY